MFRNIPALFCRRLSNFKQNLTTKELSMTWSYLISLLESLTQVKLCTKSNSNYSKVLVGSLNIDQGQSKPHIVLFIPLFGVAKVFKCTNGTCDVHYRDNHKMYSSCC